MNNKTFVLDDIKIIGSTLWSHIPSEHSEYISRFLYDYHVIKNKNLKPITIDDTNQWNKDNISFIFNERNSANCSCIILTHHAPLFSNYKENKYTAYPKYINDRSKYAFHNDLELLIKKPVCAWLYGHTHYVSNFEFNNITIATNQVGYFHEENIKFNPYAFIDLNDIVIKNLK